jgi:hypothetical protein
MTQHSLTTLSSTSATRLTPNGQHSGLDVTIQNIDESAYVYVGGEDVSAEDYGYRISPNNAISFSLLSNDAMYAITDTDESQVAVLKYGFVS